MNYSSLSAGGAEVLWAETLKPGWQLEAEKTTRIFVTVYPSERGRCFGPGGPDKFPRDMTKDEFHGLGYGIYVDPAKDAGKKLLGSSTKVEPTLLTLEEDSDGTLAVHSRTGHGVGAHGMLVRFLVAQHEKSAPVPRMINLVHAIMADVLPNYKNANERAMYEILEQMQGVGVIQKWDLNDFLETAAMVVETQREEGVKRFQTTTVNYLAHVQGQ